MGPTPVLTASMNWVQTSPSAVLSVDSIWFSSVSTDVANESVSYFTNATCTIPSAFGPFVVAPTAGTHNFATGLTGNTYYYQVTSTDNAGNSTDSACSPNSMTLDTDFPIAANTISWAESSPVNTVNINASWMLGGSGDVADQRVEYFDLSLIHI